MIGVISSFVIISKTSLSLVALLLLLTGSTPTNGLRIPSTRIRQDTTGQDKNQNMILLPAPTKSIFLANKGGLRVQSAKTPRLGSHRTLGQDLHGGDNDLEITPLLVKTTTNTMDDVHADIAWCQGGSLLCRHSRGVCVFDEMLNEEVCDCKQGWTGDSCMDDLDECKHLDPKPCSFPGGYCVDRSPEDGSFACGCNTKNGHWRNGTIFDDHGVTSCVDVVECDEWTNPPPCGLNATCTNLEGTFVCSCLPDLVGDPLVSCALPTVTVPEAILGANCGSNADCPETNSFCDTTIQQPLCRCKSGFFQGSLGLACQLEDGECIDPKRNNCHRNAICIDETPGYRCQCDFGFTDAFDGADGTDCRQVNECLEGGHDCDLTSTACIDRTPPARFECVDRTPAPTPTPTDRPTGPVPLVAAQTPSVFQVFSLENTGAARPRNFDEYATFCVNQGRRICSLQEMCPEAVEMLEASASAFVSPAKALVDAARILLDSTATVPIVVTPNEVVVPLFNTDIWVPYRSITADNSNTWVQIGNRVSGGNVCLTHEVALSTKPEWGTDNVVYDFMAYNVCCTMMTSSMPMFEIYSHPSGAGNAERPRNFDEYAQFCINQGRRICDLQEMCPEAVETVGTTQAVPVPLASALLNTVAETVFSSEDAWIPYQSIEAGNTNTWVQLGNRNSNGNVCFTHEFLAGEKPPWGTDNSVEAFMRYNICCAMTSAMPMFQIYVHPASSTDRPKTFDEYASFCTTQGRRMCRLQEMCPEVVEMAETTALVPPASALLNAVAKPAFPSEDAWIPYQSTTADNGNTWVQLGNRESGGNVCLTHEVAIGVKPTWGTDDMVVLGAVMGYTVCCAM